MPTTTTPVTTPTQTPLDNPSDNPWQEEYTDPTEICPQQHRELASPDVMP